VHLNREEVAKLKASNDKLNDQLNQYAKSLNPGSQFRQNDDLESHFACQPGSSHPNNWLEIFIPSSAISQVYTRRSDPVPATKQRDTTVPSWEVPEQEKIHVESFVEHDMRRNPKDSDNRKGAIEQLKPSWSIGPTGLLKSLPGEFNNSTEQCVMCTKVQMLCPVLARELKSLSPQSCRRHAASLDWPSAANVVAATVPDTERESGSGNEGNGIAGFISGARMWDERADLEIERLKKACEEESRKANLALAASQKRLEQVEAIKEEIENGMAATRAQLASERVVSSLLRAELAELKNRVEVLDKLTQTEASSFEVANNTLETQLDLVRRAASVLQDKLAKVEGIKAEMEKENLALRAQLDKTSSSLAVCPACLQIQNGLEDAAVYSGAAEVARLKEALTGERTRAIQAVMAVREKLADAETKCAELEAGMEKMRSQLAREQQTASSLRVKLAVQAIQKAGEEGERAGPAEARMQGAGSEVGEVEGTVGWSEHSALSRDAVQSQDARAQVDMCKERLNAGFEKVNALLAGEQEVSSSLRAVLFSLQAQRKLLERSGASGVS
jgi:hypothetical protein